MIQYLVTRQREDGTFDEVGTLNRCIVSGYKLYRNAFKYGINPYGNGRPCRVEVYSGSIHSTPQRVFNTATYR